MRYISTRGKSTPCSSAEAIKKGLAEDGGLFMPEVIPELGEGMLSELCTLGYSERAAKILYMFLGDDYSYEELLEDCRSAYCEESFPGGAAPVSRVGDRLRVLELWHGPTAAFKDMALQIMPRLFARALKKTGDEREALILVATSGDTGKAALEGYRDIDGIKIMVFYPVDGVSAVQKRQMASQKGNNVFVQSVVGNFDDAQSGVKRIFGSEEMKKLLAEKNTFLSSANSINWGRLAPQIVYYISAYCDLVNAGDVRMGEKIDVTVPTGNFGNILACYIAKKMGLPVGELVCASNKNRILTDFFETGVYDRNREFFTTDSPSMDILISSNLERLLFLTSGADKTGSYMKKLGENGRYEIEKDAYGSITEVFRGGFADETDTAREIKKIHSEFGYLIDTHTAVAMHCAEKYLEKTDGERKMLVVSTASPFKFSPAVYRALTGETVKGELEAPELLEKLTGVTIPAPLAGIAHREIRFRPEDSIIPEKMEEAVLGF